MREIQQDFIGFYSREGEHARGGGGAEGGLEHQPQARLVVVRRSCDVF